ISAVPPIARSARRSYLPSLSPTSEPAWTGLGAIRAKGYTQTVRGPDFPARPRQIELPPRHRATPPAPAGLRQLTARTSWYVPCNREAGTEDTMKRIAGIIAVVLAAAALPGAARAETEQLSPDEVRRVVNAHAHEVRTCY